MRKKNIILVGMMGSGKTLIGKALAKKLKTKVLSTDKLIEKKTKLKIRAIVAKKGWDYFRRVEHQIIKSVCKNEGVVIDCGGGVVVNPDNLKLLKKNGTMFFLKARPEVLYQRIKADLNRPLIQQSPNPLAFLKKLYKQRLPLYRHAHHTINTNDPSVDAAVVRILKKI